LGRNFTPTRAELARARKTKADRFFWFDQMPDGLDRPKFSAWPNRSWVASSTNVMPRRCRRPFFLRNLVTMGLHLKNCRHAPQSLERSTFAPAAGLESAVSSISAILPR
jgi:hypothetical protein